MGKISPTDKWLAATQRSIDLCLSQQERQELDNLYSHYCLSKEYDHFYNHELYTMAVDAVVARRNAFGDAANEYDEAIKAQEIMGEL